MELKLDNHKISSIRLGLKLTSNALKAQLEALKDPKFKHKYDADIEEYLTKEIEHCENFYESLFFISVSDKKFSIQETK